MKTYRAIIIVAILFFCNAAISQVKDYTSMPNVLWKFKSKAPIFASPLVADSLVYIGSLDSTLYAINILNGKLVWAFKTKGEIRSNVCINGKILYLNGGDGFLYALNRENGSLEWRFAAKNEKKYDFADYHQSTPVIYNKHIFVGFGDGGLYSINSENGMLIWKFETGDAVHTTPAISNGKVFFGSFDGFVYAVTINDGSLIWRFKTVGHRYFPKGEVQGSPSVFKNLVFIGARDYNIYALDQDKGYCHWNKAFAQGWGLCNNISDSVLYTGSADERIFIASNPETGKEIWRKKMEFLVFGNNAYSDGMIYVGTTNGKLHGINIKTGETIWSFKTESYMQNRTKYFKPDDTYRDDIYSIIKSNEHFLEVECELGGIFSTPYINNNNIILSSTNGVVYCLQR